MTEPPPSLPAARRHALRKALERLEPSLRIVAEDVLALASRIDLVAVDRHGRIVVIVLAEAGEDDSAVTRALAHREWLIEHLPDWLQIAPGLGANLSAGVRAMVVAPDFLPETLLAVGALPRGWVELLRTTERGIPSPSNSARPHPGRGQPSPGLVFRSGLSAADLQVDEEESKEFE
ncbi:hypothetical protein MK280_13730 [Myxococcota bacterium]|nr:hypothetical protein [Myxococcota bacterium]